MAFKGKRDGTWYGGNDQSEGSVVYGKSGGSWLYAKSAWARKDGTWQRAWTDCRRHDAAGGRDWTTSTTCTECTEVTTVTTGCVSCGSRTSTRTRTRYTKDGCPTYYSDWSAPTYGSCSGSYSPATADYYNLGWVEVVYTGTPGYYVTIFGDTTSCGSCPEGCYKNATYYIEACSINSNILVSLVSCESVCRDIFQNPC